MQENIEKESRGKSPFFILRNASRIGYIMLAIGGLLGLLFFACFADSNKYEFYFINRSNGEVFVKNICIGDAPCFNGKLDKHASVWLTKATNNEIQLINIHAEIKIGDQILIRNCKIEKPKQSCAYEIDIGNENIGCVKDSLDCIKL